MQRECILLPGVRLTPENDSKAHIIPSALGGRLKPRGLISKAANDLLNEKFDRHLVRSLQPIMAFVGGLPDRGELQPVLVTDEAGREYLMKRGAPLRLARPEFHEEPDEGGINYRVEARDWKELRTLLRRVKRPFPHADLDALAEDAFEVSEEPAGMLRSLMEIGPARLFPAAFVIASLFAAHHGLPIHPSFRTYVMDFEPEKPKGPPDTFYFMPHRRWISVDAEVAHILALVSSAKRQRLLAYVGLFDLCPVAVIMPYEGAEDVQWAHAVDVLTGRAAVPKVDSGALEELAWQPTHRFEDEDLLSRVRERLFCMAQAAKTYRT